LLGVNDTVATGGAESAWEQALAPTSARLERRTGRSGPPKPFAFLCSITGQW
jgi:hypothetical protein